MGIRLLPLIVIASLALLGIKTFDFVRHNETFSGLFLVAETSAKSEDKKADAEKQADDNAKTEDKPADAEDKTEAKDKEGEDSADKKDEKEADGEHEEDKSAEEGGHGKKKDDKKDDKAEEAPPEDVADKLPTYTPEELELLQNLSKRREELDAREHDLSLQAALLKAAAAKMDERTGELAKLQEQASAIIKEYQQLEDAKIKSLVKIYENMKPKDAARIFDTMDMPILLEVVSNMKEAKAAPILAKMDAKNAKEITTQLADKRKLPEPDNSYKN